MIPNPIAESHSNGSNHGHGFSSSGRRQNKSIPKRPQVSDETGNDWGYGNYERQRQNRLNAKKIQDEKEEEKSAEAEKLSRTVPEHYTQSPIASSESRAVIQEQALQSRVDAHSIPGNHDHNKYLEAGQRHGSPPKKTRVQKIPRQIKRVTQENTSPNPHAVRRNQGQPIKDSSLMAAKQQSNRQSEKANSKRKSKTRYEQFEEIQLGPGPMRKAVGLKPGRKSVELGKRASKGRRFESHHPDEDAGEDVEENAEEDAEQNAEGGSGNKSRDTSEDPGHQPQNQEPDNQQPDDQQPEDHQPEDHSKHHFDYQSENHQSGGQDPKSQTLSLSKATSVDRSGSLQEMPNFQNKPRTLRRPRIELW